MRQQPHRPDSPSEQFAMYTELEPEQRSTLNGYHRSSFTAIPNATRPSKPHATPSSTMPSTNPTIYRDAGAPVYQYEAYGLSSPTQSHMQPSLVDRPKYAGSFGLAEPYVNYNKLPHPSQPHLLPSTVNSHSMPMSSQTPYGPHLATNNVSTGVSSGHGGGGGNVPSGGNNVQEDISTIFVVGFPDDMQEREFQNMFTFSSGFEAATLKIPNKEYTAYGVSGSTNNPGAAPPGLPGLTPSLASLVRAQAAINDPYNLVTMNQGGVVVDGGRDGTMSSWPTAPLDDSYYPPGLGIASVGNGPVPPRKQIIGFAKFRTREEALEARDVLQSRRVDIEKGSILKAEMAKKNLHTKRGVTANGGGTNVGSVNGNSLGATLTSASHLGPAPPVAVNGIGFPGHAPMSKYDLFSGPANLAEPGNISARDRELGALGAMGFTMAGASNNGHFSGTNNASALSSLTTLWDEDNRERERMVYDAMGLGISSGDESSGPISAKEGGRRKMETWRDDRQRDRDERQPLRLRSGSAFDAFHSIPASLLQNSMVSPPSQKAKPLPLSSLTHDDGVPGPWDHFSKSSAGSNMPNSASSKVSHSSSNGTKGSNNGRSRSSRSSSVAAGSTHSRGSARDVNGHDDDDDVHTNPEMELEDSNTTHPVSNPNISHLTSMLSSTLPGLVSGVDQNPPINTLYVGNLPISPPPLGYPPDILEESLRELFRTRPGYKRLSFKQKSTGPMCFVEFEDVNAATRTINELYGNTLNGLVKGGGIRLSYSKNPLGIRTPTSANGPGPGFQQQHFQQQAHAGRDGDRERGDRYGYSGTQALSPTPHHHSVNYRPSHTHEFMISPPPPRFAGNSSGANPLSNISFGNFSSTSFSGVNSQLVGSGSNSMFGVTNSFQGGTGLGVGYHLLPTDSYGEAQGQGPNTSFSPFDGSHLDHPQMPPMSSLPLGPNPSQNQNF
ncbi:hypothetical protein EV368DRAFT_47424 [Lentinula lateritia]|nr:hypothetical protein EV368DRAFT_47424 [Lentinula lateritia]